MVALVTAQGEVARSESEIAGLQIARDRAEKLLTDRAGSVEHSTMQWRY